MSETYNEILKAALNLFADRGFHGTSIREIAEVVNIQKSSIYNHFSSKEDILEQLFNVYGPGGSFKFELLNEKDNIDEIIDEFKNINDYFDYVKEKIIDEIKNEEHHKFFRIMLKEHNSEIVKKKIQKQLISENLLFVAMLIKKMSNDNISDSEAELLAFEYVGPIFFYRLKLLFEENEKIDEKKINFFLDSHFQYFMNLLER